MEEEKEKIDPPQKPHNQLSDTWKLLTLIVMVVIIVAVLAVGMPRLFESREARNSPMTPEGRLRAINSSQMAYDLSGRLFYPEEGIHSSVYEFEYEVLDTRLEELAMEYSVGTHEGEVGEFSVVVMPPAFFPVREGQKSVYEGDLTE